MVHSLAFLVIGRKVAVEDPNAAGLSSVIL